MHQNALTHQNLACANAPISCVRIMLRSCTPVACGRPQGNCTCFELQEKHTKLYRNAQPVNLLFQLQLRAEHSNAINFFSLLGLLCCFAVYKARLFVIEGSNPFVKSKHCCVFDRVLHVRLNMCLHYYRQQFPFPLRIVSLESLLISCAQFFATLT